MSAPVVVGAGPAGVRAAQTLAAAGLRPVVLDEGTAAGGQIYRQPPPGFERDHRALYGFQERKARSIHQDFSGFVEQIDYRPNTLAWDLRDDRLFTFHEARGVEALTYERLIIATGATDRIIPVPGWTLPGVYTLGGAQVALKYQGCAIGERTVLLGTGPLLYLVAYQYARAGAGIAAVLDTSPASLRTRAADRLIYGGATLLQGIHYVRWLARRGIPMHSAVTPLEIEGDKRVGGVRFRLGGGDEYIACDAVGMGFGLRSETQLHDLAGIPFQYVPRQAQWVPEHDEDGCTAVEGIYIAGDGAGIQGADAAECSGELAALALLHDVGRRPDAVRRRRLLQRLARMRRFRHGLEAAFPFPIALEDGVADATVVCRCEEITAGQIREAVNGLGASDVNRAKAFCRVGMGRCQGRMCGPTASRIVARARGLAPEHGGRLRGQAPVKPIPIGTSEVCGSGAL